MCSLVLAIPACGDGEGVVGYALDLSRCETAAHCPPGQDCVMGECVVPNAPPIVTISTPTEGNDVAEGADVDVLVVVHDPDHEPAELTLAAVVDGATVVESGTPDAEGIFELTLPAPALGVHNIMVKAVDPAGGEGSDTVQFTVGLPDADGDGFKPSEGDCDDSNPNIHPDAVELCNGIDDNCNNKIDEGLSTDEDGDGHYLPGSCATPDDDCNDTNKAVYPGATELCDGLDNDCAGGPGEDEVDADGDGVMACAGDCDDENAAVKPGMTEVCDGLDTDCDGQLPADEADNDLDGFMVCEGDCDDELADVNPQATEVCNGVDDNCNNGIDEDLSVDADGDGHYAIGSCLTPADDCNDEKPTVHPGLPEECDGVDNDCSGEPDPTEVDADGDGFMVCQGDCDDSAAGVNPGATEVCNGVDDNCKAGIDEGLSTDNDGDGHYAVGACLSPADDCNDNDSQSYPGAPEICDGQDNDCDGSMGPDEIDADGDGWMVCELDCDDSNAEIHPTAAELCDAIDNDCSGLPDEGCVYCGNGQTDTGEECDQGANNSDTEPDACRTDCKLPRCGDGVEDTGEVCDDGNTAAGDGCSATCDIEPCVLAGTRTGTLYKWQSPCIVTADTTVPAGQTLTIEAGVVLKFHVARTYSANDRDLIVDGSLIVEGTADDPVIFTSFYDDSVAGDTNGDGSNTTPAPGDWGRLRLNTSAGGSSIKNLLIRWGGGANNGSCCTNNPPADASFSAEMNTLPLIEGLMVERSLSRGGLVKVTGGFATTIRDSVFRLNAGNGLELTAANGPVTLERMTAEQNNSDGLAVTTGGAVTISDGVFANNNARGLVVSTTGKATLTGNSSTGNAGYGLDIAARSDSSVTLNEFSGNHTQVRMSPALTENIVNDNTILNTERGVVLTGGTVDITTTWPDPGYVYVMEGDVTVQAGSTLTIDPGTVLKLQVGRGYSSQDRDLIVAGSLIANGTAAEPITFTSLYDDSVGGDTNLDGVATSPARGDWGRVAFTNGSGGSMKNVVLRYGGGGNNGTCCTNDPATDATVSVNDSDAPTIDGILIEASRARGLYMNVSGGFATTVKNITAQFNTMSGFEMVQGAGPVSLEGLTLKSNAENGLRLSASGAASVSNFTIDDNTSDGMYVTAGGDLTLKTGTITDQASAVGLVVTSAAAASSIVDVTISGNDRVARVVPNVVRALVQGSNVLQNTAKGLWIISGTLSGPASWSAPGYPYVVEGDVTVAAGVTLDVDAGAIFKMRPARVYSGNDADFVVNGRLNLNGTQAAPVIFTSYYDDTAGGDTNADGVTTTPLPGDWGKIAFASGAAGSVQYAELRWGGGGNNGACCTDNPSADAMFSSAVGLAISNSVFRKSLSAGVRITGGLGSITDSSFIDNGTWGISFSTAIHCANWQQTGNVFTGNSSGSVTGC